MIKVNKRRIIAIRADQAFKPPVRGVKTVSKMSCPRFYTCGLQKVYQFFLFVYADVAIVSKVVIFGKCPADTLRKISRNTDNKIFTRFQDPGKLRNSPFVIINVFQDF